MAQFGRTYEIQTCNAFLRDNLVNRFNIFIGLFISKGFIELSWARCSVGLPQTLLILHKSIRLTEAESPPREGKELIKSIDYTFTVPYYHNLCVWCVYTFNHYHIITTYGYLWLLFKNMHTF